ncbi:hypothetical protein [Aliiglaciecola litoralis]|uniref:Uncharacterized protein n=1 Tax=Aliiglaciecola litoralis TaxID=582857 RepID=A0ABN1LDK1_9ALTE
MNSFTQKFKGHKTKFSFDEHSLSYKHSDSEDSLAFEVKYTEVDVRNSIYSTSKNPILKFASFPFILLAIFAIGKASLIAESIDKLIAGLLVALLWLAVAAAFWWKYKRSEVSLTMFDSARGRIVIVHDGQESKIINTLVKLVTNRCTEFKQAEDMVVQ